MIKDIQFSATFVKLSWNMIYSFFYVYYELQKYIFVEEFENLFNNEVYNWQTLTVGVIRVLLRICLKLILVFYTWFCLPYHKIFNRHKWPIKVSTKLWKKNIYIASFHKNHSNWLPVKVIWNLIIFKWRFTCSKNFMMTCSDHFQKF